MRIAFVGDISFNDDYIRLYEQNINPFKHIEPILNKSDFVVGNLECLAEGNEGENELKKPRLKTTLESLNFLSNLNVKLVSLANNHVFDNLTDGFKVTTDFLDKSNINHIGAGLSEHEANKPYLIEKDGLKICILSYVSEDTNPNLPDESPVKLNWFKLENVKSEIVKYKKENYFVILYNHWGGNYENGYFPDKNLIQTGHDLIESGADLIIGHHSHTLQSYEIYKDKYIFYSLGNFCFSDIHFEGRVKKISNMSRFTESVIVDLNIHKNGYTCELIPFKIKELSIIQNKNVLRKLRLRQKLFKIIKKYVFAWKLYNFGIKKVFPYYRLLRNYKDISFIRKLRNK